VGPTDAAPAAAPSAQGPQRAPPKNTPPSAVAKMPAAPAAAPPAPPRKDKKSADITSPADSESKSDSESARSVRDDAHQTSRGRGGDDDSSPGGGSETATSPEPAGEACESADFPLGSFKRLEADAAEMSLEQLPQDLEVRCAFCWTPIPLVVPLFPGRFFLDSLV
jgi:hypothetical protein